MESRFYVPKIEEFYVGFESEFLDRGNNTWNNVLLTYKILSQVLSFPLSNKQLGFLSYIETQLSEGNVRTKYLDKEDIESLGFRFWKIHPGTTTHQFETNDGRYNITFDPDWSDGWNCTIQDEVDFTFFHGFIKNKSELKVILKQVGIINESDKI